MSITSAVNRIAFQIEAVFPYKRIGDTVSLIESMGDYPTEEAPSIKWASDENKRYISYITLTVAGLNSDKTAPCDLIFYIHFEFLVSQDWNSEKKTNSFKRNFYIRYLGNSENVFALQDPILVDEEYVAFKKYLKNAEYLIPLIREQVKGCNFIKDNTFTHMGRYDLMEKYYFENPDSLKGFTVSALTGEVTGWNTLSGKTQSFTIEDFKNRSNDINEYFKTVVEKPLDISPKEIVRLTEERMIKKVSDEVLSALNSCTLDSEKEKINGIK